MPALAWVGLGALLISFAYAPLLRSGFLCGDYARLLGEPAPLGGPLAAAWIRVSAAAWGVPLPGEPAIPFRLENLGAWLALALALRVFLRRCLGPWIGVPSAAAAATSAALLLAVHPLGPSTVASLDARGELLGLALGFTSAALFLRSRQEERDSVVPLSWLLLLLAGAASAVAFVVALAIAASEYFSARRYRRRTTRTRTAATTLVLFGAAALLPSLLSSATGGTGRTASAAAESVRDLAAAAVEDLGRQVLPAEVEVFGVLGQLIAASLLLLALQPAFRAALSAPRLWGGLLVAWGIALACAEARSGRLGLVAPDLGLAWSHLSATVVVACLLGLTCTALAARRALVVPLAVALGYAALAHGHARAWTRASAAVAELAGDVVAARALEPGARLLLIDPPSAEGGLEPLGRSVGWLAHPRLTHAADSGETFDADHLRALSSAAFLAFVCEPEFETLRARGLVVLAPTQDPALPAVRTAVPIRERWPANSTRAWRTDLTHHFEPDLDPLDIDAVRLRAELATPPRELERLGWRTRDGGTGSAVGRVTQESGEEAAYFDLSGSLAWRLAGRVRSLVVERGARQIEQAEILAELPVLQGIGAPETRGRDWIFSSPGENSLDADGTGAFVLRLLALDDLECDEIWVERENGALRAREAQDFAARVAARDASLGWSLDYRIGAHTVARSRGRRP